MTAGNSLRGGQISAWMIRAKRTRVFAGPESVPEEFLVSQPVRALFPMATGIEGRQTNPNR